MTVSVVIPAHNEEQAIAGTINAVLQEAKGPLEILVIADHCTDRTEEIVLGIAKDVSYLRLLRNERERGFANAVITGFQHARGEFVIAVMADRCDDPRTINSMREALEHGGVDVVCGSRYMKGGRKIGGPMLQDLCSRIVCYSLRLFARVPTWDATNALKMYRLEFLLGIPYDMPGHGTEYSLALLIRACARGGRIIEVPTMWTWREPKPSLAQEIRVLKRFPGYWPWYRRALLRFRGKNAENIRE